MSYIPTLKKKYTEEVVPALHAKYNYKSVMQVPKLTKIVINQGVGAAVGDKKLIDNSLDEISRIALRENLPIGVRVTLRGERMYEFLERLMAVALPQVRDFKGINDKSFDGRGNYTLGITEHIIFPEIDIDKIARISGMDITFVTTANTDDEAHALLKEIGLPFKKK